MTRMKGDGEEDDGTYLMLQTDVRQTQRLEREVKEEEEEERKEEG